jgi:hypothetical protein
MYVCKHSVSARRDEDEVRKRNAKAVIGRLDNQDRQHVECVAEHQFLREAGGAAPSAKQRGCTSG